MNVLLILLSSVILLTGCVKLSTMPRKISLVWGLFWGLVGWLVTIFFSGMTRPEVNALMNLNMLSTLDYRPDDNGSIPVSMWVVEKDNWLLPRLNDYRTGRYGVYVVCGNVSGNELYADRFSGRVCNGNCNNRTCHVSTPHESR